MGMRKMSGISPAVWNVVELDLMGPFVCKSEGKEGSPVKVWARDWYWKIYSVVPFMLTQ